MYTNLREINLNIPFISFKSYEQCDIVIYNKIYIYVFGLRSYCWHIAPNNVVIF